MNHEYLDAVSRVLDTFFNSIAVVAFGGIALSTSISQLLIRSTSCILFLYIAIELERYNNKHYGFNSNKRNTR